MSKENKKKVVSKRYHGHDVRGGKSLSEMYLKDEIKRNAEFSASKKKDSYLDKTIQQQKDDLNSFGGKDEHGKSGSNGQDYHYQKQHEKVKAEKNGGGQNIETTGGPSKNIESSNKQITDKLSSSPHKDETKSLRSDTKKTDGVKSTGDGEKPKPERFGLNMPRRTVEQVRQSEQQRRNQEIYNQEKKVKKIYYKVNDKPDESSYSDPDIPESEQTFDDGTADAIDKGGKGDDSSHEKSGKSDEIKNLKQDGESTTSGVKTDGNDDAHIKADTPESSKLTSSSDDKSKNISSDEKTVHPGEDKFGDRPKGENPESGKSPSSGPSNDSPESQQERNRKKYFDTDDPDHDKTKDESGEGPGEGPKEGPDEGSGEEPGEDTPETDDLKISGKGDESKNVKLDDGKGSKIKSDAEDGTKHLRIEKNKPSGISDDEKTLTKNLKAENKKGTAYVEKMHKAVNEAKQNDIIRRRAEQLARQQSQLQKAAAKKAAEQKTAENKTKEKKIDPPTPTTVKKVGVTVTYPSLSPFVGSHQFAVRGEGFDGGNPYGGKTFRVRPSQEKRERIAQAMQAEITTGVRVMADTVIRNGGEVGAGIRTLNEYRTYAALLAAIPLAGFIAVLKKEQSVRAKADFRNARIHVSRSALKMSDVRLAEALRNGEIFRTGDKFSVAVKNSRQFLQHINEELKISGVSGIKIPTGATGNKLIAIANRHIRQTKLAMAMGKISKADGERIIAQMNKAKRMGKKTLFAGKGKFRLTTIFRRIFSIIYQKTAKNGGEVGAGLSIVLKYKRMAMRVTRTFIRHVKRTARVSWIIAKKAWIKAVKVATDRVRAGTAGRVAKKIHSVNKNMVAARRSLKNAVDKSAFGRGKAFLRKYSPKNLLKNAFGLVKRKLKGTRVGKQVVKLGKKVSNSLFGRAIKGVFKGISNVFSFLSYGLYTIKKWALIGLSTVITFIIIVAVLGSLIESAAQAFNFATNRKKDQDRLVSTLNELYDDDIEYMTSGVKDDYSISNVDKITFTYDKDPSAYEENLKEIVSKSKSKSSKRKKQTKQSLNVAEILSMTYVRFNYNFKKAKYTPITASTVASEDGISASEVGDVNVTGGNGIDNNVNAQFCLGYLMGISAQNKLTNAGIAGIMANIQSESSFNVNAISSDGHNAKGLIQWQDGRKTKMLTYLNAHGVNKNDAKAVIKGQLDFMIHEMKTSYKKTWQTLQTTNSPAEAGRIMCTDYERPANKEARGEQRGNLAEKWYKQTDLCNMASSVMGGLSDTTLTAPGVTADNSAASDESSDDSTSGSKKSKSSDTPDSADPGDINAQAVELKGMDAVVEYAKELWYGSHIINVKLDDSDGSDSTAEIEYKTTAFGSLFSQPRALSRQVNVISSSSMDSTYGTYDFGDATAQEKGYYLLRKEGGFTHEAACGIMGNISVESGDDWDVHCVTGENVGLFQNSQDELAAMKKFCSENNLDFYSVEGQIRGGIYSLQEVSMPHYSELESKLKDPSVYKDEAGAISAANDWAAVYERCVGSLGKSKVYAGTFSQYNGKTYQGLKTREERAAEFYKKFLQYKDNLDGLGITETGMMDASALMTDGVMNVPYLNQAAGWLDGNNLFSKDITLPNGNKYGGGDMQSSGCSLCSTAMIMSYAKGQRYSPNDKHFTKYFSNDRANMAYNVAQDLGLSAMRITDKQTDKVISELKSGHPVFTHLKSGVTAVTTGGEKLGAWSSTSGHFIALIGYKKVDGKDAVAVADPGHKNHAYAVSHKWFPLSNIVSALKTEADPKPFTSVSPSPELLGASSGDMSLMQKSVISYCKQKLGSPYQYGACHSEAQIKSNDTNKFDCSGYVNWVFTHATGKLYNYSSDGWASAGSPIDVHELQPGDVLAKKGSPGHVAIYAGNNKMYEAPSSGGKVHLTAFRNEFTYFRRIVAGSPLLTSSVGSGSIMIKACGKTKKYTNAQFVAQIQKLSMLDTTGGWCGRWTSRAWGALLDGTTTKYNSAFSTLGADAYAYSRNVEFHKTSDVSSIPVGADVIWSDSSGGAGHIGIYIGGGKYISNIGHDTPSVRDVLGSNDGLKGNNYHFEGWGWHTRNGKQVVFPA